MKVKLHRGQLEVARDRHRFRIVCAGRRWGKSVLSRMVVLRWATRRPGLYWIVSPTYKQAKTIHWREMQKEIPRQWIQKKNEVELSFTLKNGSIIELKGAENPDTLRGVKLRGLVIDEIASIRSWLWLWQEVLRATLTDYEAPAIFISTPKGYNHFFDLFERGQEDEGPYRSWKFSSYDNPFISRGDVDAAKKELPEDTFAQEYLADFRKFTGLVYKTFERKTHVVKPFDIPDAWDIYGGVDFGSTNPTAFIFVAIDNDDNWFVFDEHYESGKTIDYHSGIINAKPYKSRIRNIYGDPSGAQWIKEFNERGIYITPATRETGTAIGSWVRLGIERVSERLKRIPGHTTNIKREDRIQDDKGEPRCYVFDNCTNTIREFTTYRWKEKSVTQAQDLNEPDVPEKANDHALDAFRYFAVSYEKQSNVSPPQQWDDKQWQIGR